MSTIEDSSECERRKSNDTLDGKQVESLDGKLCKFTGKN